MLTDHEDREPDRPLGWGMRLTISAMIMLQLLMFGMLIWPIARSLIF